MTEKDNLMYLIEEAEELFPSQVEAIADHLIANGVTVQRWIPVTEKMPEDFVSVLIVAPGEHPLPLVHEAYHANNCWVTLSVIYNDDEITHWMPLPPAPEEVE